MSTAGIPGPTHRTRTRSDATVRDVSEAARPGVQGHDSNQPATLFVALYGHLPVHPWRDPSTDRDPYILFHDRSLAMGWLDDSGVVAAISDDGQVRERQTGIRGLWSMNDAGGHHERADSGMHLAAWYQVELSAVPGDRSLPVQPFLRCATDATAQIGRLELHAAQILLPVQALDTTARPESARMPSLQSAAWFDDRDPNAKTSVEVTLDTSQPLEPRRLQERIEKLDQRVFLCEASSSDRGRLKQITPPFDDTFWGGPSLCTVVLRGTLAEWSAEAVGWLGAFLAELTAREGINSPLLLTVRPRQEAG